MDLPLDFVVAAEPSAAAARCRNVWKRRNRIIRNLLLTVSITKLVIIKFLENQALFKFDFDWFSSLPQHT